MMFQGKDTCLINAINGLALALSIAAEYDYNVCNRLDETDATAANCAVRAGALACVT